MKDSYIDIDIYNKINLFKLLDILQIIWYYYVGCLHINL